MDKNRQLYLEKINCLERLELVLIGQDPYPYGANGIAFCKNTFDELFASNCCGKDVLYSLGFAEDYLSNNFLNPIDFFLKLLEKGIAFINVCEAINETSESKIENTKSYNLKFIEKAKSIVILGKGKANELFKKYYPEITVDEVLLHPSGYNKANNYNEWAKTWNTNYLNKYLKSKIMEARFFIADPSYNTWKKVYVLTSDGALYCEYLDYMRPKIDKKTVDFDTFSAEDYSFGGYQSLREVSQNEATSTMLTRQPNWVNNYLTRKGVL